MSAVQTWTLLSETRSPDRRLGRMIVDAAWYLRDMGWTYRDIGGLVGCSRQTLARRLRQSAGRCRERLSFVSGGADIDLLGREVRILAAEQS